MRTPLQRLRGGSLHGLRLPADEGEVREVPN